MRKKPEILAPVGSWKSLLAAIENGADAVYLGGQAFNARQYAQNFTREELAEAVRTAHLRKVKVLITVNTLIANGEMEELVPYLSYLYQLGVDGIIVQDLGVARLARELFPALPLHASTQMTVHNVEGAKFLEGVGFTRVIPARELCLAEIRRLVEETSLEVEVFVHGALCICYSGQCLMSSLIWGRSGNRGRCAQPCRLEYKLICEDTGAGREEIRGGHLLSTRDLRLIEYIPDLCRSGVASFKIEGRMKRPEYVATVVRLYREALDRYWADPENYRVTAEEKRQLSQIFNRSFTTGYLLGKPKPALVNYKRPNNQGLSLGRVEKLGTKGPVIKLASELGIGDELRFWISRGGRVSHTVEKIWVAGKQVTWAAAGTRVEVPVKGPIRPGDRVFKIKDARLEERAQSSYQSPPETNRIPVSLYFRAHTGEPCSLLVRDGDGNQGRAETDFPVEEARKHPLTREKAAAQLLRLGNTPFYAAELEIDLAGGPMVPFSEINSLRRRAIEELAEARLAPYMYPPLQPGEGEATWRRLFPPRRRTRERGKAPRLAVSVNSRDKVAAAVEGGADLVYLGGESFREGEEVSRADLAWAVEYCHRHGVQIYAASPRLVRGKEMEAVREFLREGAALGVDGIQASNLGVFQMVREEGLHLPLAVDYYFNLFNSLAVDFLRSYGVSRATLSPELDMKQVEDIVLRSPLEMECLVAGQLPLMVIEGYVNTWEGDGKGEKGITGGQERKFYLQDRKEIMFPLLKDQQDRIHIFNARELCLVGDIPRFAGIGVDYLRIEGRNRDPDYVAATTDLYRQGLTAYASHNFDQRELVARAEELYPWGRTKGHYYRGVE